MQQMRTEGTGAAVKPEPSPARLEEAFVLLDNSSGRGPHSQLFTAPAEVVVANFPEEVEAAFQRLEAGRAAGLYAAGFFSFELGYVLEPRLSGLMPRERKVPLMWFGLYRAPRLLSEAEVDHWLSTHTKSGSYQFSNVSRVWSGFRRRSGPATSISSI
jgi:para-aminobenzoate synthetase/4-amino-4-deoxychorismate lyase